MCKRTQLRTSLGWLKHEWDPSKRFERDKNHSHFFSEIIILCQLIDVSSRQPNKCVPISFKMEKRKTGQLLFDRESRSNLNWRKWMLIWMQKWAVILLLCVCVCVCVCVCDCILFRHLMRQSSIKGDLKPVCVNCRKDMKSSRID